MADIEKLRERGSSLAVLMQANEDAAASGNEAAHMQAFQKFNDALIAYEDLQQDATTKLALLKTGNKQGD